MKELLTALVKAKLEFKPIKKDRVNPHYKNAYATLDSVLESVEPALLANGLLISQRLIVGENSRCCLVTELYHTSGQKLESFYDLPDEDNPQKKGIAITYARRYSVCAILSVTADEDDDGNGASLPSSSYSKSSSKTSKSNSTGDAW